MAHRISVVGNSGAGTTWLASRVALRLDLPHLELDALHHRANWEAAPPDEFRADVEAFVAEAERTTSGWVIDGNYRSQLANLVSTRADMVVWLDYPRRVVIRRVVLRSAQRLLLRRRLWHGNREQWPSQRSSSRRAAPPR